MWGVVLRGQEGTPRPGNGLVVGWCRWRWGRCSLPGLSCFFEHWSRNVTTLDLQSCPKTILKVQFALSRPCSADLGNCRLVAFAAAVRATLLARCL